MANQKSKSPQIRNSTTEFLIFSFQTGDDGVEVRVQDGTVWLSQKLIADLFQTSSDNIGLHLKNIYAEEELAEAATTEDFSVVQKEGNREVRRTIKHVSVSMVTGMRCLFASRTMICLTGQASASTKICMTLYPYLSI